MIKKFFTILFFIMLAINVYAQDYFFFSDSPNNTFYDPSWGFANAPSFLERVNNNKFPVSTTNFFSGLNSLKLRWNSQAGGDWGMAVASEGWVGHNVNLKDSLSFYVLTNTALSSENLPLIYIEDLDNNKTPMHILSNYTGDIPADVWTRIFVPLSIFKNNPGAADLTQIKTVFFGQATSDGGEHTLYLDEVRMISSVILDTIRPTVPQGVIARGFEHHIDLKWTPNTETDLMGYYLYKFDNSSFVRIATTTREIPFFTDFVGGYNITGLYKISAFDSSNNESFLTNEVTATTYQMNNEEFLDMVQRATFRYFWDWGDPNSGIARERWHPNGSDVTNTIGGGGFGVMAILVGIERGFVTREQGAERMLKITDFLSTKIDTFHGAFPHWFNGSTGKVVKFGNYQDGGDIVETAFMIQGLLAARQYFYQQNNTEVQIRNLITQLWQNVDWDFFRNNSSGLYWNWSPTYKFNIPDNGSFIFYGWNETLIAYILAIASPTKAVNLPALSFYRSGWGNNGLIAQSRTLYGYPLYVGSSYGGPLFWTHYSFLGFDPRNKKDEFANYFTHNRNQTLVNRRYCMYNPNFTGYGENNWGLTASYSIPDVDYTAHEPNNDNGTITPTAAISSMPYTPNESIAALKHFYRTYGPNLWGDFGFKDAFNLTYSSKGVLGTWFSDGYLAIDQGPIIVMIENYRSQLLWNKFMANPEIQSALTAVGFVPDSTTDVSDPDRLNYSFKLDGNYPNPFNPNTVIRFELPQNQNVSIKIYNVLGENVRELFNGELTAGINELIWNGNNDYGNSVPSGVYIYRMESNGNLLSSKMILQK